MAYAPPLPPPGEPPGLPVDVISGVRAELNGQTFGCLLSPEKQHRLEIISQASEEPSLSNDGFEASSVANSVDEIIELDRINDEGKAWTQDERRPSWVSPKTLHRVSNDDLQEAALRGDLGLVRRLVHAGASVNAPMVLESQDEIMTLMHVLALRPEIPNGARIIAEIIRANVDLDARSSTGLTPLMCACQHKHVGAVELLVGAKVDASPEDDLGRNALTYAVATGLCKGQPKLDLEEVGLEILRLLQQVDADFDNGGKGAHPPIVEAVKQLNVALVREMIHLGATPDGLPEAASAESAELIKVLSSAKANPFVTDEVGFTALEIAEKDGIDEIAKAIRAYIGYLQDINHHHVLGIVTRDGHPIRDDLPEGIGSQRIVYTST